MAGTRTLEEVRTVASHAKLNESELAEVAQTLYFDSQVNSHGTKLLEVDKSILKYLEEGNGLYIQGEKTDSAVLCTGTKTYSLKEAETSNTLLILPECQTSDFTTSTTENSRQTQLFHRQVCGLTHHYYELKECRPRLSRLKELLEQNLYQGELAERTGEADGNRYTFSELSEHVQASQEEIKSELQKLQAFELNGYWRILDFEYESDVLNKVLAFVDENSWNYDQVPLKPCLEELELLFPKSIIEHCLNCYAEKRMVANSSTGEMQAVYTLCEDKICKFLAEILLKKASKFNLTEFLKFWQQSVPEGMQTDLRQLEGSALVNRHSHPPVIWHYPASELPEDEKERFNSLFKTRERWTLEEITPYIRDLTNEKLSVEALLQKYSRSSTNNDGTKVFNSKRPIK